MPATPMRPMPASPAQPDSEIVALSRLDLNHDGFLSQREIRAFATTSALQASELLKKAYPCDSPLPRTFILQSLEWDRIAEATDSVMERMQINLSTAEARQAFPKGVEAFTTGGLKPLIDVGLQHSKSCAART